MPDRQGAPEDSDVQAAGGRRSDPSIRVELFITVLGVFENKIIHFKEQLQVLPLIIVLSLVNFISPRLNPVR